MRNLTINRRKTFVACLAKMKVYIEDYIEGDTIINDVPCRKLGDLKNGEVKTFLIGDEPAKVFVVADKLSRNFSNEFINIPAGAEDIFLSGKNWFNLANGNAFRFDGVADEDVLKNRKKNTNKGIVIIAISLVIGFIIGLVGTKDVGSNEIKPETFSSNGMKITLTNEFIEVPLENYTFSCGSPDVAVLCLKEEFALMEGFEDYTLREYGELVIENNGLSSDVVIKTRDGLTYFEYQWTNPEDNVLHNYFSVVYKAEDAFWLIQFSTVSDIYEDYMQDIVTWAKTVEFTSESSDI